MAHAELDLRERRVIEDMLNAKIPVSRIATEMLAAHYGLTDSHNAYVADFQPTAASGATGQGHVQNLLKTLA